MPPVGNHRWSDLGCLSDNNILPPAEHPSQLWWGAQWTLQLCLWCHLGLCHQCIPPCQHCPPGVPHVWRGCSQPTAFELPHRKEACHPGLICIGWGWVVGWFHCFLLLSLLHLLEIIGIHLFITACHEVCHCRSGHASIWWHGPVESTLGTRPWGFGGASTDVPPTLTPSPHPFAVGRAPGSGHVRPWHCCNVHPAWQVHHLKWCLSPSFLPTPWDSPVRSR